MAAIRGSSGPSVSVTSQGWGPAGVGDLAILWDTDGPRPAGWTEIAHTVYSKRLTAGDIAAPQPVAPAVSFLLTASAAGGVGRVRSSKYATLSAGGVGVWLGWMSPYHSGNLASATYQRGTTVTDPYDGWRHGAWARAVATAGTYDPGSVNARTEFYSIEILPLAVPLAPVWVAPAAGAAVDRTQPLDFTVTHQSGAGLTQDRMRVEVRVAAGTWQHLAADGTLQATAQELVRESGTATLDAAVLTANTTYEARAYTHDEGGWSPASATLTFVARTPPTVAVTLTTAAGDLSPTVSWTTTPGLGVQASWEVRIALAGAGYADPVASWQSRVRPGTDTSWQAPADSTVTNGGSYVAWVRVTDQALALAWTASTAQTVSWTPPAAPTSATATDGTPLTVTVAGIPAASVSVEVEVQIGSEWVPVAAIANPDASEVVSVPLATYGVARTYRARSIEDIDGVLLPSAWVSTASVATLDTMARLVSEDGSEWLDVRLLDAGVATPLQQVSASTGLGATVERVDRTPVTGWRSWWLAHTTTAAEHAALMSWLTDRTRFYLRPNPEHPLGGALEDVAAVLVAVVSTIDPDRNVRHNVTTRRVRFDWTTQ